ncbi:CASP-like protein 1U1 [Oryza brachyantha]|uniref:CASP-like protein 1U1 n=1 Tax=Oryza brachyantha TaxID=4533 RepID=UPI001ADB111E|nr:CASP-like protein 1U1 [Oryza brachyantha]
MTEVDLARAVSLFFRIAVVGLSVAAAVVMATASQVFPYGEVGVSYTRYSAFVYFVVATVASAVCSAAALYLSVFKRNWVVTLLDVVTMGLLFSAAGAVFAVRRMAPLYLGVAGANVDVAGQWVNGGFCQFAGAFCWRVTTSATICAFAAGAVSVAVLTKDARYRGGKH